VLLLPGSDAEEGWGHVWEVPEGHLTAMGSKEEDLAQGFLT